MPFYKTNLTTFYKNFYLFLYYDILQTEPNDFLRKYLSTFNLRYFIKQTQRFIFKNHFNSLILLNLELELHIYRHTYYVLYFENNFLTLPSYHTLSVP